jgi:UDP-N-acetylglucosamine 2-epimerase (non-hydrolysing)
LRVCETYGDAAQAYALLTLHRPSNVDDDSVFDRLMVALAGISRDVPILFPVHPRTRAIATASTAAKRLIDDGLLRLLDPLGYLEFVGLMTDSRVVLTDSGGIQEETTILGIPCLTLRENTERPVTVTDGTNHIVGTDPVRILNAWEGIKDSPRCPRVPELWDGSASNRIVDVLRSWAAGEPGLGRVASAVDAGIQKI